MSPTRGSRHPPGPRLASPGPGDPPPPPPTLRPGPVAPSGVRGFEASRVPAQLLPYSPAEKHPPPPRSYSARDAGGGAVEALASPVSATILWPGRTERPRGRTEAAGRAGSPPKRVFAHGSAVPHPGTASKDRSGRREQERGTVGKRRFKGLKGQAGKTAGRGPTVEPAKVGVRNARLDGRQDLKGVQELRRQLRGVEGVPARERLKFICAWTVRTPSARPPPRSPGERKRALRFVGTRLEPGGRAAKSLGVAPLYFLPGPRFSSWVWG